MGIVPRHRSRLGRWLPGVFLASLVIQMMWAQHEGLRKPTCARFLINATWLRSHEEDHDGLMVYRPESYTFPMSRGPRSGIRLLSDGTFVSYGIGAGDRGSQKSGNWKFLTPRLFELQYANGQPVTKFRIVSCAKDKLSLEFMP
jgi:hypothetical protein